jgi:hypothetical protein
MLGRIVLVKRTVDTRDAAGNPVKEVLREPGIVVHLLRTGGARVVVWDQDGFSCPREVQGDDLEVWSAAGGAFVSAELPAPPAPPPPPAPSAPETF